MERNAPMNSPPRSLNAPRKSWGCCAAAPDFLAAAAEQAIEKPADDRTGFGGWRGRRARGGGFPPFASGCGLPVVTGIRFFLLRRGPAGDTRGFRHMRGDGVHQRR